MNTLSRIAALCALLLAALPLQAQVVTTEDTLAANPDHMYHGGNIVDVAKARANLSTLVTAIEAAGLTEELMGEGPFTIFAPANEAFADLDEGAVERLLSPEGREQLIELLSYHVVPGMRLNAQQLQARAGLPSPGAMLDTMGGPLPISSGESAVTMGGAAIVVPDIEASNGIIHVIANVITPPSLNDKLKNN